MTEQQKKARVEWELACTKLDELVFPSADQDKWATAVSERDAAFQRFMMAPLHETNR